MSSKGYKWYNNGITQVNALECPEGFVRGMLRTSVEKSKATNKLKRSTGDYKTLSAEEELSRREKISNTKNKLFFDLQEKFPREVVYKDFIEDNMTYPELQVKYNVSEYLLGKLIKSYGIKKDRSESAKRGLATKYSEAGSKEEYDKLAYEHLIENLDVSADEYYKNISDKVKKTKEERYGTSSYRDIEKTRATCLERYGVDFPCQRPEARHNGSNVSSANKTFNDLLTNNNINFTTEFPIGRFSYDFKVDNTLIEVDPYATHNSTWGIYNNPPKDNNYHLNKSMVAEKSGYTCIHVWDWDDVNKVVSMLKTKTPVYARKCVIREVEQVTTNTFLNDNHLQGTCTGQKISLGLYYKDELVQLMTFGKPRYNKNYEYELLRLCSSSDYAVVGGADKLFKHFVDNYNPKSVISYCDNSKFSGEVYKTLGFSKLSAGKPGRHWYNPKTGRHITDNLLRSRGFDQLFNTSYGKESSNEELMREYGFVEIYDCGQSVYIKEFDK